MKMNCLKKYYNTMIITDEIKELFELVKLRIGGGIRSVQIEDQALCALLQLVISDYGKEIQKFIMESQWMSIYGKNKNMTSSDWLYALTTRTMDMATDLAQYFSKNVGLQQRGTKWELKKDYFTIEKGKQSYLIPAGREIQRVLYCTPSTTKSAIYANYGFGGAIGAPFAQVGNAGLINGFDTFYFTNLYDIALTSTSLKMTNSFLRGDLCYKITAGPEGTHIVHLMSTPGSPMNFKGVALDDQWGRYVGCDVWYWYYDTLGSTSDEVDECRLRDSNIVISPDSVPFEKMQFEYLNEPSKAYIRRLLLAEAMITVGLVRGYASGKISIAMAEMQLDYSMLLDIGKQEKQDTMEDLKQYLEKLLPQNVMKNQADLLESQIKILSGTPMGFYVI